MKKISLPVKETYSSPSCVECMLVDVSLLCVSGYRDDLQDLSTLDLDPED